MKRFLWFIILGSIGVTNMFGQDKDKTRLDDFEQYKSDYEAYIRQSREAYQDYCEQANADYAAYMAKRWEEFQTFKAPQPERRPEPPKPVVKDKDRPVTQDSIPFEEVIEVPVPMAQPQPQPLQPIADLPAKNHENQVKFEFFGTPCYYEQITNQGYGLNDLSESAISAQWEVLSKPAFRPLLRDALSIRDSLHLCDWGYIKLTEQMAQNFCQGNENEAVLLQMFLLTQSGYKVRLAKSDRKIYLLVPSSQPIYGYSFVMLDGIRFYVITKDAVESYYVFNHSFPKEQLLSIAIEQEPILSQNLDNSKEFASARYPEIAIELQSNKNLIDFYNQYPVTSEWNLYVQASLSTSLKKHLFEGLRPLLKGKSEAEATNILLNFVQTAFDYKTDNEQFGYERPLFGDETFFYPYSDCEDRAILFSILVRELLGLDVVLLNYPAHLATAVHFNENVSGDYIKLDKKQYIVCDPTYIGASIGEAMPQLKNIGATVIRI